MSEELSGKVLAGDERALSRAITLVERGTAEGQSLLQALRPSTGRARIIGITGAPGSGKSTLVDRLIAGERAAGRRVAVVAIDPTSPFSGGAILGDRIRMTRWHQDQGVFIRSLASRGQLGGLSAAALQVVAVLDAAGFDTILLETVGVGQSEVDIVQVADTTVLVLTPGQGDGVQAFKAGVMEIADLFVVNKADQPGANRLRREIAGALTLGHGRDIDWQPPIVDTVASEGQGMDRLAQELERHHAHLAAAGRLGQLRHQRARFEISAILADQLRRALAGREDGFVSAVLAGELTPLAAVRELLADVA
jgi:LAO/AO transport system kinase